METNAIHLLEGSEQDRLDRALLEQAASRSGTPGFAVLIGVQALMCAVLLATLIVGADALSMGWVLLPTSTVALFVLQNTYLIRDVHRRQRALARCLARLHSPTSLT
jgi:hypothetical protein